MASEMRPAKSVRVSRSRPLESVPNQKCFHFTGTSAVMRLPSSALVTTRGVPNRSDRSK